MGHFQVHSLFFCGFPWVETSTAGRVYDLCVLLYDGSTRRLTESGFMWFYGFMEKPGIEPATPGLQGIALIHYTTGASQVHSHGDDILFVGVSVCGRVPWLYQYWPGGFMLFCGSLSRNSRRLNRQWFWF